MPAYRFEALDADGKTVKGLLEGDNAKAIRAQLRARQLVPLDAQPVTDHVAGSDQSQFGKGRVFNTTGLTIWTRQIAGLVSAGLPLERALTALADEAEEPKQRELVAHLRAEVNAGASFGRALATAPREFDDVYRAVVSAGEQSGQLGRVLDSLANDLEEQQALKAKLVGAALYPAIVSIVAVVIVIFLVSYVVPQVAQVFAGSKHSLPFITVAMLAISSFVRHWGWLLALVLAAAGLLLRQARRIDATRLRLDAAWLRLPLIGRLARGYNAARFASTLAMLAAAGVPILKALQAAIETLSNRAMRADASEALVRVREGAPLASALSAYPRFPGILSMFARLGEQTGELPLMLQRAAQQLGTEVQRRAMQMATLLEPLLIVVMGLVVMLIVLAVLLPIIQLNTWVK